MISYQVITPLTKNKKNVYIIRHGEAAHNLKASKYETEDEKEKYVYEAKENIDPPLSQLGIDQAKELNKTIKIFPQFDLVVVSPLIRTLETMQYAFNGIKCQRIANPLIREKYGRFYTDCYNNMDETISKFKDVDFKLVKDKIDPIIGVKERESVEHCEERGNEFFEWLCKRNEKVIGVVSHSAFLKRFVTNAIIHNKEGDCIDKSTLKNGEMRVIEIDPQ